VPGHQRMSRRRATSACRAGHQRMSRRPPAPSRRSPDEAVMWNSEQPAQALKEKCGEEMKSDNMWDLGPGGEATTIADPNWRRHRCICRTGPQVTLNASSDIFARCSKFQTLGTKSRGFRPRPSPTCSWSICPALVEDETAVFFPCRTSTAVLVQVGQGDAVFFPLMLHMLKTFPISKR